MLLSKNFIAKIFTEALQEFNDNIYPIDNKIELEYISTEKFLADARNNSIIQMQLSCGIYKNFDKEYPNFFVVYNYNKDKMRPFLGLPYKVTLSFDLAKDKMKPFKAKQVNEYFKHSFIHELGHIYEEKLIAYYPEKWDNAFEECKGDISLAKELLVDDLASSIVSSDSYTSINEELWMPIVRRMKLATSKK